MKPTLHNNFSQQKYTVVRQPLYEHVTLRRVRITIGSVGELHYISTPCSGVLEKLPGSQIVKKMPAFYGTQRFITTFTTARHLSLSSHTSTQSMPIQLTQDQS